MQNALYLDTKTQQFLNDFQLDYSVELIGIETDEADDVEAASSWNGHYVGYSYHRVNRLTFEATGFKFHHPRGAIISGKFSKPVVALEVLRDSHGDELDSDSFIRELRTAIMAKCGNISGFADCNLV